MTSSSSRKWHFNGKTAAQSSVRRPIHKGLLDFCDVCAISWFVLKYLQINKKQTWQYCSELKWFYYLTSFANIKSPIQYRNQQPCNKTLQQILQYLLQTKKIKYISYFLWILTLTSVFPCEHFGAFWVVADSHDYHKPFLAGPNCSHCLTVPFCADTVMVSFSTEWGW